MFSFCSEVRAIIESHCTHSSNSDSDFAACEQFFRAHPESCRLTVSGLTAPKKSTDSDSTQAETRFIWLLQLQESPARTRSPPDHYIP
jgi:hypothetical protein